MTGIPDPLMALWEPHIHAFAAVDPAPQTGVGPLSGLRIGVKDIIDVAGFPTRNGSVVCAEAAPAMRDADCVAPLRAAGARIMGKTVTTEFAFIDPTACRNPHDLARSPGGSSSGSGAAVAAGVVDLALGTQTAGSLCRPAAYCGVVGVKPSYGAVSVTGVTPLSPSFDSVGIIARDIDLARRTFEVMTGQGGTAQDLPTRVCRWLLPGSVAASPDTLDALDAAADALAGCATLEAAPDIPCDTDGIVAAHRIVMLAEAAAAHGHYLMADAARLQPRFRAALVEGLALAPERVATAQEVLDHARAAFWTSVGPVDALLTLPVPEGAPLLGDSTGFQNWLTPWTVFGGPLISLPWGMDRLGRPRAVMLAGRPGADLGLLDLAAQLEALAPPVRMPRAPEG